MRYTRHLRLEKAYNVRDLGGYPTEDGRVTRFGVFLRADAPCDLTAADIQALTDYGVTASLDLRTDAERSARPSSLREVGSYYEEPVFDETVIFGEDISRFVNASWAENYIRIAEHSRPWVRRAMEIAAAQEGCLLYHCTTGKDRTGLLSCFLLSAAGVPKEDIAADYCVSEIYLEPVYARLRAGRLALGVERTAPPPDFPAGGDFFRTHASTMLEVIGYFDRTYGGVRNFLLDAGVHPDTLEKIRSRLTD